MSIRVILITHEDVGSAMLNTVKHTYGELPLPATVVAIKHSTDIDVLVPHLKKLIKNFTKHDGVLILTDMYGSTPSNIAVSLQEIGEKVQIISGLNLPMLMRVMNYPQLELCDIVKKAISGGKDGIMDCSCVDQE